MVTAGVVALALAGTATALIASTNIENQIIGGEAVRDVKVEDSNLGDVLLQRAKVEGSQVDRAFVEDVTIEESYLEHLTLRRAFVENSRIAHASIQSSTLEDTTVCNAAVNERFGFGDCHAISLKDGDLEVHAVLGQDAPERISPGDSYDIHVHGYDANELTVENDPGGLVPLGFETPVDPLGLQGLGFEAAAGPESVDRLELWHEGELREIFALGDTVELPDGAFTLRVHTAEMGIIDHSRLALVMDMDGNTVRPAMTQFDVVATELVIPPLEGQLFAPFLADDVARLVLSVPIDEGGNVDRDINVSFSVEVLSVNASDVEFTGDLQDRARLHDDSRLFSEAPFSYASEVDQAHHPQTLEMLVRETLVAELPFGAINAYGTHLVAIGPYETEVSLSATAMNANGDELNASIDIMMGATPEDSSTLTVFGTDFELPGRGDLHVRFTDDTGAPMEAGENWSLFIQETPDSHAVRQSIAISEGATETNQALAASVLATTPLGNFQPSAYLVCVDHDGQRDCANGGELVSIETGETRSVEIDVS